MEKEFKNEFNQKLNTLVKELNTKNEACWILGISRVRLHDILTEKHELKQSTFKDYETKINTHSDVNFDLRHFGTDINNLQSLIFSDINEVLSFTGEPIENAQRWVDIKETRVFFIFDAETPETIEIKEITIIDPDGEVFNAEKAKYITNFINN